MVKLGMHYGQGPFYLKDIAKSEDISEKYLSQIIIPLKNAGLVDSFRGARGGYFLARSPESITLGEIIAVLEGDFNLVKCVSNSLSCSRVSVCVTRELWSRLGNVMGKMLDALTLAELVSRCKDKKQKALMYSI
jgi:Rrf2 family protein